MQKTMKEKKRGVWGNYFRMLMEGRSSLGVDARLSRS
jgi:hypothetical protein